MRILCTLVMYAALAQATHAEVSVATRTVNADMARALPFADVEDEDFARRGFIASWSEPRIRAADGRVAWDFTAYDYLRGPAPETVNPSLWRQSELNSIQGLFEVTPGIYQVRGLDLSNMTIIEGDTGVILIDPLVSTETASAT